MKNKQKQSKTDYELEFLTVLTLPAVSLFTQMSNVILITKTIIKIKYTNYILVVLLSSINYSHKIKYNQKKNEYE